ncbi:MAG: hypothetical protein V1816_14845 [Pseudomonadota bacterium]
MKTETYKPGDLAWKCAKCDETLVVGQVALEYLGNRFAVELPKCPKCGLVLVTEDLASGKMSEVEQILEDK